MRRVAADLGVDPMTLYRYVGGKEALLDGVVEIVWQQVTPPLEDATNWSEALRSYAATLRAVVRAHPAATSLLLTRPIVPRSTLEAFDGLLDLLRSSGFEDQDAARLIRVVTSVVLTEAARALTYRSLTPQSDEAVAEPVDAWISLAQLLPDDTPSNLVRTAYLICAPQEADDDVAFLVDLIITGAHGLEDATSPSSARNEHAHY
jgi:AcrR family transcriptional regulator